MKNTSLQLRMIDMLDNVVARIEEIVTDHSALTRINVDILKNDIRGLYKLVCEIERTELESPVATVHKMKDSVSELKKKLELIDRNETSDSVMEPESYRPAIGADSDEIIMENDSDTTIVSESDTIRSLINDLPEPERETRTFADEPDKTMPDGPFMSSRDEPGIFPVKASKEKAFRARIEPEHFRPEPENETGTFTELTDSRPANRSDTDPFAAPHDPTEQPEPDLSDFIPRETEVPSSYVTRLTAMAQAHAGEQDMSKVAVSSTAMPDENVIRQVENRSDIFSKLKETEALHTAHPQNALKSLVDRLKTAKTVNDTHHAPVSDLKSAIGINEKFLFINELFKGNTKEYGNMLQDLETAQTTERMTEILAPFHEKYRWNKESLAYITLSDLLKKKFGSEPMFV